VRLFANHLPLCLKFRGNMVSNTSINQIAGGLVSEPQTIAPIYWTPTTWELFRVNCGPSVNGPSVSNRRLTTEHRTSSVPAATARCSLRCQCPYMQPQLASLAQSSERVVIDAEVTAAGNFKGYFPIAGDTSAMQRTIRTTGFAPPGHGAKITRIS
jgi:hypothetical protein